MKYRIISIWIMVMMTSPFVLYALGVRSLITSLVFWEIVKFSCIKEVPYAIMRKDCLN